MQSPAVGYSIIAVPEEKLSAADQKFLTDIASGKPTTPARAKKEIPADKPLLDQLAFDEQDEDL